MYPTEPSTLPPADDDATPPPRRKRNALKLALVVLGTVLLVGVPSAVALVLALNRGHGDELARMVPANVDIYTTVLLDPSLAQKRNLESVLEHFPQLHTQQQIQHEIDSTLHDAFKDTGLDYQRDVQPWLGPQIAVVADIGAKHQSGAILLRTNDEHAAAAAFDKLKAGPQGKSDSWTLDHHGGVTIYLAHHRDGGSGDGGYAIFDHTVVYASDPALIDSVIDTDQGRTANLAGLANYKQTLRDLPADNLGVLYVNAASLIHTLKDFMGTVAAKAPSFVTDGLASLDAYQAFGAALSLQPNAVALDSVTLTDPAKMTASMRQALSAPAKHLAMLGWIPQDSYALVASSGPSSGAAILPVAAIGAIVGLTVIGQQVSSSRASISEGLSSGMSGGSDSGLTAPPPPAPSNDQLTQGLQQLGISGPDGILAHLTGESALFVGPSTGPAPVSAVAVLGTDDPAKMESTLQKLGSLLTEGGQQAQWQVQQDGAIAIHYLDLSSQAGVLPAYAMVDGYAVVGTDPVAVRHAVEAHRGLEGNVTSAAAFRGSEAASATGQVMFLDLQRILGAVENTLSGSDRADFDKNVAPDLRPLRTLVVTSSGDLHHQSSRMVVTLSG
jgi:hypothetical protein